MSRFTTFALAWVVAAAAALAVAWQGVALVGRQVTDDRPGPLSAAEIREAIEASESDDESGRDESAGAESSPGGADVVPPAPEETAGPATTQNQPDAGNPPPATTTSTIAEPAETRPYDLIGGSVALQFSPSGVTLLWATPNPGFEVDSEPEGSGIKVEFESDSHRSRVDGWWDGGAQDRVREEPRSSD